MNMEALRYTISTMSLADLEAIKEMIEKRDAELYDENWKAHDHIDDYLYYVYYDDGTSWMHCIAKKAYEEYLRNDRAVCMKRKTKDLFPTWEDLIERSKA